MRVRHTRTVAIVGAGASGTLAAINLLRMAPSSALDIRLIDPSEETGRGVAYRTQDSRHRLNVPVAKMSALADDSEHFSRWLAEQGREAAPTDFVPRGWYGEYLEDTLERAIAESPAHFRRIQEQVAELGDRPSGISVRLSSGTRFRADWVVLAMGSPRSDRTWAPDDLIDSPRFVSDPWAIAGDNRVAKAKSVLLVGTGLTMVDVALSLQHVPVIHAVSRTGLLPQVHHAPVAGGTAPLVAPVLPSGSLTLAEVRQIVDRQVQTALVHTGDWRPAIDSLRPVTNELWSRLSDADRATFLKEDVRRWDTVRHRMPPEAGQVIHGMLDSGQLTIRQSIVDEVSDRPDGIEVRFISGNSVTVDLVVDCTGPAPISQHAGTGELLLARLTQDGVIRPHMLDLGLDTDPDGHAIDRNGHTNRRLIVIGPLRRGALWETTAIPEIRCQAQALADEITSTLVGRTPIVPRDRYGLEMSATPDAVDSYNEAVGRLLRVQSGVDEYLAEALCRDPDFALAHLTMAVLAHEYDAVTDARQHLQRAQEAVSRRGTQREQQLVAALGHRITGADSDNRHLIRYLTEYPRDALAASVALPTIAFAGIYEVPADAWAMVEYLAPHYGTDWWFSGLLAFTRQEQRRWDEAEALCARALAEEPGAGTAVHARAHVFFETGQHEAGLHWIDAWIDTCGRDAVHRAHFSWHAALHELAMNDSEAVRRRYDRQLAPPKVSGMRALVDSASLLWRANLEEPPFPGPSAAAVLEAAHPDDIVAAKTPFAAMHAAIALALEARVDDLEKLHVHCCNHPNPVMRQVASQVVTAMHWYVIGNYSDAADLLIALSPQTFQLGGSEAQREVLQDTAIAALIKSGRMREAALVLSGRLDRRPRARDQENLARVLEQLRMGMTPHEPRVTPVGGAPGLA